MCPYAIIRGQGSSPLARGPQWKVIFSASPPGLIPARAGTTNCAHVCVRRERAHPRSRGDHVVIGLFVLALVGSSPLARGPQPLPRYRHQCPGLIPARAGTTCRSSMKVRWEGAHPRSRGDHTVADSSFLGYLGSSPLARGPHPQPLPLTEANGLIPARAGTTTKDCGL